MELTGGERLHQLRAQRGLSQEDVAVEVGVSPGAVSQWETGRVSPRRATAILVDRLLAADGDLLRSFGYAVVSPPAGDDVLERVQQLQDQVVALATVVKMLLQDEIEDLLADDESGELREALRVVQ